MGANPAAQRAQTAINDVRNTLYPNATSAEVVGMKQTNSGTRVGVAAEMPGLFGGTKYATVTVDRNNQVVLQNKCTKSELFERIDRVDPSKQRRENFEDAKATLSAIDDLLVADDRDDTSPPFRCSECGRTKYRYLGIISLWKKTGDGEYSCRNCGNIVRFGKDEQHVHEHG